MDTKKFPEIVTICGSTKFCDMMAVKMWELSKQGIIALGPQLLPKWYTEVEDHLAEHEGVVEILDELHFRKIDISNSIFVMNVDGYIGNQTKKEIEYAKEHGKPVNYLEPIE